MDPEGDDKYVAFLKTEEPAVFTQLCVALLNHHLDLPPYALEELLSGQKPPSPNSAISFFRKPSQIPAAITTDDLAIIDLLTSNLLNHTEVEGLFRIPGNSGRIEKLKVDLKAGNVINFAKRRSFTHHDMASALKYVLSTMELLPTHTRLAFLTSCDLTFDLDQARMTIKDQPQELHRAFYTSFDKHRAQQIKALQLLLCLLSSEQRHVLHSTLSLLYEIAKKQSSNKMSAANLAMVFAPHLFSTGKSESVENDVSACNWKKTIYCVTFMIRHVHKIFSVPPELRVQVGNYYRATCGTSTSPLDIEDKCSSRFRFMSPRRNKRSKSACRVASKLVPTIACPSSKASYTVSPKPATAVCPPSGLSANHR